MTTPSTLDVFRFAGGAIIGATLMWVAIRIVHVIRRAAPCKLTRLGRHQWEPMVIDGLQLNLADGSTIDAVGVGEACWCCMTFTPEAIYPAP